MVECWWLFSRKALVVLNQVLNNKGLEGHGGVVSSVFARHWTNGQLLPCI